ncbi:response regulator [Halorarius litoreus]|uniref:response regulator n=1 Tax=Halorarius litoreus TaxID=2962676 RepID=UPI0020CD8B77|nr:response regulator [Halorarius litoreus]
MVGRTELGVLHVDDDSAILQLLVAYLDRRDVEIRLTSVTTGGDALDRLQAAPEAFDVVVCDYSLASPGGVEFLEIMRESFPDLPVIVFTGRAEAEETVRDHGAADFFVKGDAGTLDDLAERIVEVVDGFDHRVEPAD